MLPFLPIFPLAQTPATPAPQEIIEPQEVRPLPGQLNTIPTFNSNSPEVVIKEGILLSTFPPEGKKIPGAHLNFGFQGRFDIFTHHIARAEPPNNLRTLYLGIIVKNPGNLPVKIDILQAASYLSQPDAPFIELPSFVENPTGSIYAGPGSRVMNDILRGIRQDIFPPEIVIPPGETAILSNLPIPVRSLTPPLNGRSTLMRLRSDGLVYVASLGMYGKDDGNGSDRPPTLAEWQELLENGDLSTPRDKTPTPLKITTGNIIYGRVAGVAQGSQWSAQLVDNSNSNYLSIPELGKAFSFGISTLQRGLLGTNQVQSANMLVRYPDTAYLAHGNYGIEYNLTLPLYNPTDSNKTVSIALQTPVKTDDINTGLRFLQPPARQVFFRGTVRIKYNDDMGLPQTRFVHLVQRRGQQGEALVVLNMKAGDRRLVQIDFLYPPDATPPQVLTIKSLDNSGLNRENK